MVLNMITIHNYGTCSDHESDIESIEEQSQHILRVQETTNEEISVNITVNNNHEPNLELHGKFCHDISFQVYMVVLQIW